MKLLKNKKGFSLAEIMIVVVIMGILVAVAVPVYTGISESKRIDDCFMNREMISAVVKEAMNGMIDNGKKQPAISMESVAATGFVTTSPADFPAPYASTYCLVLNDMTVGGAVVPAATLGAIRGGYRTEGDYDDGCDNGNYLKRSDLAGVKFYTKLANQEIPQCAFEETDKVDYNYYIFSDGTVLCDCEKCYEAMK
jgi:prepilin-type N-terminal cleavage/methylation domain-containing protein